MPTMAVPGRPCNTILICASIGPVATFEPFIAGNAPGMPMPLAWWQATQLAW